jgi:nucleoid-associated protein YgaU
MPQPRSLPPEGVPDAPRIVDSPGAAVRPEIHNQLTSVKDISAAHNFFKPTATGTESFLPSAQAGPKGFELGLSKTLPGAITPTGFEAAAMPGGMPMPGAEQVSPLVNMIMKLPGHIGLASSFFEVLANFFMPGGSGGDLLGMLDPSLLEHGSQVFSEAFEGIGEHMSADLSLLDGNAPIFETMSPSELASGGIENGLTTGTGFDNNLASLGNQNISDLNASQLEVGGGMSPGKAMFEQPEVITPSSSMGGDLLAMDPGGGFNSTIGPAGSSQSLTPTNYAQQVQPTAPNQGLPQTQGQMSEHMRHALRSPESATTNTPGGEGRAVTGEAGDASAGTTTDATQINDRAYTVESGDNLWDLAQKHLGDGTRWGEIYKLNEAVIGSNPRLIMPGTELQLPGDSNLAMNLDPYTVKPGDNLWNISKDHLGGGQNWHDLYSENAHTIGTNPDLIHPGQHLNMPGAHDPSSAAGSHLASNPGSSHAASSHNLVGHNPIGHSAVSHNPISHSHVSHNPISHSSISHSPEHAGHNLADHTASGAHATSHGGDHQISHSSELASRPAEAAQPIELKAEAKSLSDTPMTIKPEAGGFDSSSHVPSR